MSFKLKKKLSSHKKYLLILLLTAGLYFIRIFSNIISFKPNGFYAGHQNVWSDWALHISFTNIFANKPISEWFLFHPLFSGGKLTYAFLTNAISGILMKMGFSLVGAMIWPSIIFVLLLFLGMYFLFFKILNSRKKSLLAIYIFLTSSGPGFFTFIKEFLANPKLSMIAFPPIDYSRLIQYNWLAGNIPVAMMVPQRSFLLGLTIGVWSLLLFLIAFKQNPIIKKSKLNQKKLYVLAGLLAGILPIAHMHSFIALVIISGTICISKINIFNLKRFDKNLLFFIVPAGILSTILYSSFINGGIENPNFMQISIGWSSEKNLFLWLKMWWELWGITIPLAIYSLYSLYKNNKTKDSPKYFYGFFAIFIIANIIVFQPIFWDNTKLFAWVYLGFSLLASNVIVNLWRTKGWRTKITEKLFKKIIAVCLIVLMSATGVLELIRLNRFDKNTFMLNKKEEIEFAEYIRDNTDTDDVFLTATTHNHPITVWGSRSIVLGYTGWAHNFGFNYYQREQDIKLFYENPKEYLFLLREYDIDYIYIGKPELNYYEIDQDKFDEIFQVAFQNEETTVYAAKKIYPMLP